MLNGLIGKKCGMTRFFLEDGISAPVTVIEILSNRVVALRTKEGHGYDAYQVTTGSKRARSLSKAEVGHFDKSGVEVGRGLWEVGVSGDEFKSIGDEYAVDLFSVGQKVDVTATSIGKGYAGVIKRYNFKMQDATHGNSVSHRAPGSIGQNQTPGRVFKGKKMAGRMGGVKCTVQNLEVVAVMPDDNCLLVKGGVPGAKGGDVHVRPAVKQGKV